MRKKIRIWVFSLTSPTTGVSQVRLVGPFSYFPKDKFEFVYAPSLRAILRLFYIPDIIIFHRNSYRLKEINKIIKFAHSHHITTIMEIDDLITHVPPYYTHYSYYQKIKPIMIEIFKKVDILTVSTERLKEYYKKYNSNIYVLPNLIDERIWSCRIKEKTSDNKIVIGYAGLSGHVYDFKFLTPAIEYILSNYPNKVCFKFIGCIPDKIRRMPNIYYIPETLSETHAYQKYARLLMNSNFTFVLAPLEENEFNQCKSNIKFLEYSICGYPGIYSAVGPYLDVIQHNKTGLLVKNTTDEWISAMKLLINDTQLRNTLSKNAHLYVKTKYLLKERAEEWYKLYLDILSFQKKRIIKNFSFSPLTSYAPYIIFVLLRKAYYRILKLFKRK